MRTGVSVMKKINILWGLFVLCMCLFACGEDKSDSCATTVAEPLGTDGEQITADTAKESETEAMTDEKHTVGETFDVYEIMTKESLQTNGGVINYRLYVPEDYTADKAYPVLLFLHGAGERGDDNTRQLIHVLQNLFNDADSPVHEAIVVAPQCPAGRQWVNTPWAEGDYRIDQVPESQELQNVLALLDHIGSTYRVDENRRYVMGISMGGFGTWDLLLRHEELFAAGVPICGGGDASQAASLKDMPLYTFHDAGDASVPVEGTRAMVAALKAAGNTSYFYEETTGYGHGVWTYAAERQGLMDWLFAQTREGR